MDGATQIGSKREVPGETRKRRFIQGAHDLHCPTPSSSYTAASAYNVHGNGCAAGHAKTRSKAAATISV